MNRVGVRHHHFAKFQLRQMTTTSQIEKTEENRATYEAIITKLDTAGVRYKLTEH